MRFYMLNCLSFDFFKDNIFKFSQKCTNGNDDSSAEALGDGASAKRLYSTGLRCSTMHSLEGDHPHRLSKIET